MDDPTLLKPGSPEFPETRRTPEQRLLAAIFQRALQDYIGSDSALAELADEWFFCGAVNPPYEPFSLPWICEHLDEDIVRLRSALLILHARHSSAGRTAETPRLLARAVGSR